MKKTKRQKRIEARRQIASDLRKVYLAKGDTLQDKIVKLERENAALRVSQEQISQVVDSILIRAARSYGIVQGDNYLMEIPREQVSDTLKEYQVRVKHTDESMCIAVLPR